MDNLLDDYYFAERHYVEQRIRLERKIKALNTKELLMNDQIDQTVVEVIPTTAEDVKGITHPREDLKSVTVQSTEVTGVPAVI